jgi:hypothetical protein
MSEAREFLEELAEGLPEDERMILCGFAGNPNEVGPGAWKPRPWRPGREQPMPEALWNGYVTVSSFRRVKDGSFRRRGEGFAAGRALMVDDVGTKVDRATVEAVEPTWRIETSPGNEQWWYMLSEPERDGPRFDGVIRAFISGKLLGADPGMSGVTRVGRLPGFQNDKPQYGGWTVRTLSRGGPRYTCQQLLDAFGLFINGRREPRVILQSAVALERNRMFMSAYKFLQQRRMLKRAEPDPSGWVEMSCPWVGDHTGGADTGAAIREPSPENEFYGAFRCHHGHCADRGWGDLTDWIAELAGDELENAATDDHSNIN